MSVLCSACQMRPAHRVWESGRGKCGDCYALDPSEPARVPARRAPPAPTTHTIVRATEAAGPPVPDDAERERRVAQALRPGLVRERLDADEELAGRILEKLTPRARAKPGKGKTEKETDTRPPRHAEERGDEEATRCPKHGSELVVKPADAAQPEGRQVLRCPWAGCATVAPVPDEPEETKPVLSGARRDALRVAGRRKAIAKANPKREAVLADARTRRYTCRELAEKHGLRYSTVYTMCWVEDLQLPKGKKTGRPPAVQARAQPKGEKVQRLKGETVEGALARRPAGRGERLDGGRVKLAPAAPGEEILVPLTARTSALIWSGVASLPLAEQAELLRKLEL